MSLEELKQVKSSEVNINSSYWFGNVKFQGKRKLRFPVYLGKTRVYIDTEIIDGNIPWLIGTRVLRKLGALIDTDNMELRCQKILKNERIKIKENNIGHIYILN